MVLTAIGQVLVPDDVGGASTLDLKDGRIRVDAERRSSLEGVWAGGDCIHGGQDLTVSAVEDGKQAALPIDRALAAAKAAWRPSRRGEMADLSTNFLGIKSPNPFWLASAPPTDKEYNVVRAFKAGWGGVVWKTLGEEGPPVVNVSGPRYGAIHGPDRRLIGLNNIELITDRPLEVNLREIKEIKLGDFPDRARGRLAHGALRGDGLEGDIEAGRGDGLRRHRIEFRLPARHVGARHGGRRRPGARLHRDGDALVQAEHPHAGHREAHPQHHRRPLPGARGEARRRGRGLAHQHRHLDHAGRSRPHACSTPHAHGKGTHGGYCGPAVEADRAWPWWRRSRATLETSGLPISAIGGISNWRDAARIHGARGRHACRCAPPP